MGPKEGRACPGTVSVFVFQIRLDARPFADRNCRTSDNSLRYIRYLPNGPAMSFRNTDARQYFLDSLEHLQEGYSPRV